MRETLNRIVITVTCSILALSIYANNKKEDQLGRLKNLVYNNLIYDKQLSSDSVILWSKQIIPELEKSKQYELLFQIKLLVNQAYIQQGNLGLAIENAKTLYTKAKEMDYPLGLALSLKAIGKAYLVSSATEEAIESYEEALERLRRIPDSERHLKATLYEYLFIKLKSNQLDNILPLIGELDHLCEEDPDIPTDFYGLACHAFYCIQNGNIEKSRFYLDKCELIQSQYSFVFFQYIIDYLYAKYYQHKGNYDLSLNKYKQLLANLRTNESYIYIEISREEASLLATMGRSAEACLVYEDINKRKELIDVKSYTQQINELHTLYKIDQNEVNYQIKQKRLYWGITIGAIFLLLLIVFFILCIKKDNKSLLESKLKQEKAKKQAERSIKTKSLFLSNMSHEIRTPLNALCGFSTILTEESIDSETRKQCNDIILQNSELLLKLINDVIDLSSLETENMQFNFQEYDAITICRNVIDMVERIKQTNASIHFKTNLNSLILYTDKSRLQQVLINLLINATKFTAQGSITLEVEVTPDDEASFSVTDTGCGIPKEKQDQMFNRFEKGNENAQGTGLGLSISELIITYIGGKIWIDKDYTNGSRFVFTHPLKKEAIGRRNQND
ncbi:MAG: ATP-binding protein [Bacteroides sp.]